MIIERIHYTNGASDATGLYFDLTDRLGSVRDVLNSAGTSVAQMSYDAWGNQMTSASTYQGMYGWDGYDKDAATSLYYDHARYYDPQSQRWMSQDPMGFDAGDSNLYRYVNNAPTDATDPSGMKPLSGYARDAGGDGAKQAGIAKEAKPADDASPSSKSRPTRVDLFRIQPIDVKLVSPLKGYNSQDESWAIPIAYKLTGKANKKTGGVLLIHTTGNTFQKTLKDGTITDLTKDFHTNYWSIFPVPAGASQPKHLAWNQNIFGIPVGTPLDTVYKWFRNKEEMAVNVSVSIEVYYVDGIDSQNEIFKDFNLNNKQNFGNKLALADEGLRVRPFDPKNEFSARTSFAKMKNVFVSEPLSLHFDVNWKAGAPAKFVFR